jgi:hypothetical protein
MTVSQTMYFVGRLFHPKRTKFINGLSHALTDTIVGMEGFDPEVRILCYNWLGRGPHSFVKDLFLKSEEHNEPFIAALERAGMRNPKACLTITQGYYLKFLKNLTRDEPRYKQFSAAKIEEYIRCGLTNGGEILAALAEFEEAFKNFSMPDDLAMCYVGKIPAIQYPDETDRSERYFEILGDSKAMFWLTAFTVESLKFTKECDSRTGAT